MLTVVSAVMLAVVTAMMLAVVSAMMLAVVSAMMLAVVTAMMLGVVTAVRQMPMRELLPATKRTNPKSMRKLGLRNMRCDIS